ncbi:MAG: Branched-chain amino acid transport ATP-binding protein LivF, partial [uncultured Thermomicrobiales bacterium]
MSVEPLLAVEGLRAAYERIEVLHGLDLIVHRGEIVAVIGANGAGKSTTLKVISGLLPPRRGRVRFAGRDITGRPAEELVGLGLSHVPERRQLFGTLTVEDNLLLGAYARRDGRAEQRADLARVYDLFPILRERRRQAAGTLSGGQGQMLALGRGLMARPSLLLLDEPSVGLAPLIVREIFAAVATLRAEGTTVLLVEQNARAALRLADRGYVLETGRVVLAGPANALMADPTVQGVYLGQTVAEGG